MFPPAMTTKKRLTVSFTAQQLATLEKLADNRAMPVNQYVRRILGIEAAAAGLPWNEDAFRPRSQTGTNLRLKTFAK